ncbi:MAG: hypothetical protein ACI4E1_01380 [Lachnospira sp.]
MEQTTIISSPRWKGRLENYLVRLIQKYRLYYSKSEDITLISMISRVKSAASSSEQSVIDTILNKYSDALSHEKDSNITYSDEETKAQIGLGYTDVDAANVIMGDYDYVIQDKDFAAMLQQHIEEQKKRKKKKAAIVLAIIGAIILAFVVFNLPFVKEIRAYNRIKDYPAEYSCKQYYEDFPDGKHTEDVLYLEESVSSSPITVICRYLRNFPQGKYSDVMRHRCDSLWDEQISHYEALDKSTLTPNAQKYMHALLQYMKKHFVTTIKLEIESELELKDYTEYDKSIRDRMERFYDNPLLPLKENMVSIKKNFSAGYESYLTNTLQEGVSKSFEHVFDSDFVSISTSNEEDDEIESNISPVIHIKYIIKSQEDKGYPHIWCYSETTNGIETEKAYLIGIDIRFIVDYTIPNSEISYTLSEKGTPENDINGISDITEGYQEMTKICFAEFSNKMAKNIGLAPAYLPYDEE